MAQRIGITETIFRDAHQSLWATRMTTDDMMAVAEAIDEVGFYSLEAVSYTHLDVYKRQRQHWETVCHIAMYFVKTHSLQF